MKLNSEEDLDWQALFLQRNSRCCCKTVQSRSSRQGVQWRSPERKSVIQFGAAAAIVQNLQLHFESTLGICLLWLTFLLKKCLKLKNVLEVSYGKEAWSHQCIAAIVPPTSAALRRNWWGVPGASSILIDIFIGLPIYHVFAEKSSVLVWFSFSDQPTFRPV